ncbi:MAG TPA: hypothetical protein VEV84_12180 [Pyrinomonadaceae bacterium]|nr:hypothetical protein [Pyrinomonadaceae bacterium]
MANYTTSSGFSDLNGSMVASNGNVTSYTSTNKGAGNVTNLGGTGLNFNVSFTGVARPYHVTANPGGNGFSGSANNGGPAAGEETWTATATTAKSKKRRAKAA